MIDIVYGNDGSDYDTVDEYVEGPHVIDYGSSDSKG